MQVKNITTKLKRTQIKKYYDESSFPSAQPDENYRPISLSPHLDNSMEMCASVANNNTYLFTKDSRSGIQLDVS